MHNRKAILLDFVKVVNMAHTTVFFFNLVIQQKIISWSNQWEAALPARLRVQSQHHLAVGTVLGVFLQEFKDQKSNYKTRDHPEFKLQTSIQSHLAVVGWRPLKHLVGRNGRYLQRSEYKLQTTDCKVQTFAPICCSYGVSSEDGSDFWRAANICLFWNEGRVQTTNFNLSQRKKRANIFCFGLFFSGYKQERVIRGPFCENKRSRSLPEPSYPAPAASNRFARIGRS